MFRTELRLIKGDQGENILVVHGDGDPAFGDPVLLAEHGFDADEVINRWVQAVDKTGIKQFDRLLVDDRVFDRQFVHPTWPKGQLIRDYCAEVSGLNFHRNCIDIRLIPAEQMGQAPEIELYPDAPFIETVNNAITGEKDAYWFSREPDKNQFTMHGSVRHRPSARRRSPSMIRQCFLLVCWRIGCAKMRR